MNANLHSNPLRSHEGFFPAGRGHLFYRAVGSGRPVIVLHGGPDFDHGYLLPDMDRLADRCRLVYYDQRGRGRSAPETQPHEVSLATEIEDLEALRAHLQLDQIAVLGHSFGGILAMEYAIRHPARVSHLILMNTAPASQADYQLLSAELMRRRTAVQGAMNALVLTAAYQNGDPETVTAYYRLHFGTTIPNPQHLDKLMAQMRLSFRSDVILRSRAIEDQLYKETWSSSDFDLFPGLRHLKIPALILHGDQDFVPLECAAHVAQAIPGARLSVLKDCGHFAYLESPDLVREAVASFLG